MSLTLQALGIAQLRVEEKLALVQHIWDSIAAEVERSRLTEAQQREVNRRFGLN
jgi:putative addiction module component (TIGR02574 family)